MSASPSSLGPVPFPSTMWSEVLALRGGQEAARRERFERLIGRYWKPVYWAVRAHGGRTEDEARDATQDFFVRILEGQVVSTADPSLGSFRSYLKGALRHFLLNQSASDRALRRGGGVAPLRLDFDRAGPEPAALGTDPAEALDRAWAHQLLAEAAEALKSRLDSEGRGREAEIFLHYETAPAPRPTYDEVAARFGVTARDVWNALRTGRRAMREQLMERIGPYVRNEAELLEELRELFGR